MILDTGNCCFGCHWHRGKGRNCRLESGAILGRSPPLNRGEKLILWRIWEKRSKSARPQTHHFPYTCCLSCPALSCPALPCPALPIPVVCLALPCLAYTCCAFLCLLGFLCLLSVLVCSLYLCLPVVSMPCRVQACLSLLLFVVAVPCVCLCLWGVLPLCSFWCFVWVFLYGGCCLCRGFSLLVVSRSGCGSVWCCRWSCRGLPCGRLGVWWFVLLWFMLVVSGGGALGTAGRCGRSFWSLWCWGCLIGVWGSLARSLGISQLPACLVSEFLLRFSIKPRQHVAYFGFC